MDAAARLRPFLLGDGQASSTHGVDLRVRADVFVAPCPAWMDHSVARVQYRRVWRGFAPRG